MIIIKFPDFIQNNLEKDKNIFKQQIYGCPSCVFEGKLYSHGSYLRNLITEESSFLISIYRVKCPICGKTHALIPDILIPYFQHSFSIVKKCLELKYLENASYSSIVNYFQSRNINSYFSEANISNFVERFTTNIPKIRSFFNTSTEIYTNEKTSSKDLTIFIDTYDSTSNNSFNVHFFKNMPAYFMSKPQI
jgi:alpha-D-ribose 1-methylphosphonate 5-phosphate C-P lyase